MRLGMPTLLKLLLVLTVAAAACTSPQGSPSTPTSAPTSTSVSLVSSSGKHDCAELLVSTVRDG